MGSQMWSIESNSQGQTNDRTVHKNTWNIDQVLRLFSRRWVHIMVDDVDHPEGYFRLVPRRIWCQSTSLGSRGGQTINRNYIYSINSGVIHCGVNMLCESHLPYLDSVSPYTPCSPISDQNRTDVCLMTPDPPRGVLATTNADGDYNCTRAAVSRCLISPAGCNVA